MIDVHSNMIIWKPVMPVVPTFEKYSVGSKIFGGSKIF